METSLDSGTFDTFEINRELKPEGKTRLFREMFRIRRFEQAALKHYQAGIHMGGFLHLYIGQESVAVGKVSLCGENDHVITAYRDHGHALAVGMTMNECMAELFGKETPIRYLAPDVKGKSQQGWLWTYSHPQGNVVFEWNLSRSREGPREFLKNFQGQLQTDGYGVYESLSRERGGELTLIGCWAHARRGVHEALDEGRAAAWIVGQIGLLYAVEKTLRAQKAGPQLRAATRAWQSRPILTRLRRALAVVRRRVLPQSLLGQAIDYLFGRWVALIRYVDDGRLEIDNNLCENAIRPTAVGKKNFLFIGHPEAGQRSAVIYSVLGSCRRLDINPAEYLFRMSLSACPKPKLRKSNRSLRPPGSRPNETPPGGPPDSFHRQLSCQNPRPFTERLLFIGSSTESKKCRGGSEEGGEQSCGDGYVDAREGL